MCHPSVLTSNTNTVITPMVTYTCYFYYYPFTWRCLGQNPKSAVKLSGGNRGSNRPHNVRSSAAVCNRAV